MNIEGLGRQLYPDLNLWDTAQPFLEEWLQQRYSPQSVLKRLQRHAPSWIEQLPQLPDMVLERLQQSGDNEQRWSPQQHRLEEKVLGRNESTRIRRYLLGGVTCVAAIATAIPGMWQHLGDVPWISWLLAALGAWLLWPRDS